MEFWRRHNRGSWNGDAITIPIPMTGWYVPALILVGDSACATTSIGADTIRVYPTPVAYPIHGIDSICVNADFIFTDTPAGGAWTARMPP